jgi:hypothetical protein
VLRAIEAAAFVVVVAGQAHASRRSKKTILTRPNWSAW